MGNVNYSIRKLEGNLYSIKAPGAPEIISKIYKESFRDILMKSRFGHYDGENIYYRFSKKILEHEIEHKIWDDLSKTLFGKSLYDLLNGVEREVLAMYFRKKIGKIGKINEETYLFFMSLLDHPRCNTYFKALTLLFFMYGLYELTSYTLAKDIFRITIGVLFNLVLIQFYNKIDLFCNQRMKVGVKKIKDIINEAFRLGIPLEGELPENLKRKLPEFYNLLKEKGLEKYPLRSYILWRIYRESRNEYP